MNLTDDEIRIKVAEAMGARWHSVLTGPQSERLVLAFSQWTNLGPLRWELSDGRILSPQISNYPESLDACAEFEKTLTDAEQPRYALNLWEQLVGAPHIFKDSFKFVTATARQRCIAYLKTKGILP